jgi:protein disulfide-isomerase
MTLALLLSGCKPQASAPEIADEIAWNEGGVDESFQLSAEQRKPVLLYWGARWCPPCNRLKATLFKDPAFVAETRNFVPVHLDGDSAGAQKWGEYFGIAGYPTLIVLNSDKREITRLSDGSALDRLPQVLALVLKQNATAAELREKAMQAPDTLTSDEWSPLANYSWDEDVGPLAGQGTKQALLEKLAATCPVAELKPHFALLALDARAEAEGAGQRASDAALLSATLTDPARLKADYPIIEADGGAMIVAVSAASSPERQQLASTLATAMDRIAADPSLPLADRVDSLGPVLDLYKRDKTPVPTSIADKAKQLASLADHDAKTPFERQSVVPDAAEQLDEAGDPADAQILLKAELGRSQQPYYAMAVLAAIAKEQGDADAATQWLKQAYDAADGPATRTQWGVNYIVGLVDLAPADAPRIEQAADQVIDELKAHPDDFYERTRKRFERLRGKLEAWSKTNDGGAVLARLHDRMQAVCPALPAGSDARKDCTGWLSSEDRQKA